MSKKWYKPFIVRHKFFVLFLCVAVGLMIWGICSCVSYVNSRPVEKSDKALEIAKKEYGLEKTLWVGYGSGNEPYFLRNTDLEHAFYVIGINGGEEKFIAVPAHSSNIDPIELKWEFDHSFSEMISWLGEFGYKYSNGFPNNSLPADNYGGFGLQVLDSEDIIKEANVPTALSDAFYDRLDVKVIFSFRNIIADDYFYDYYLTQEDGRLKLYERFFNEGDVSVNTIIKDEEK